MSSCTKNNSYQCPFCLSKNTISIKFDSHIEEIPSGLSRSNKASFNGFKCITCKSITSSKLFDKDLYKEGFYSKTQNYDRVNPSYDYTGPLLKKIISASKNGKVLDFGAGQGATAIHIKNLGVDVDVLEPDEGYRKHLALNFNNVMSDIEEIKEKYNCIFAIGVLEHLSDIPDVISSLYEKLRKDGVLIMQYPNPTGFSAKYNFKNWDMLYESGHNFIPSLIGLRHMLERQGISIDSSYTSSIISRGRVPFFAARVTRFEKVLKNIVDRNIVIKFLYNLAWKFQGILGLGETLVVVIKKN